MSNDSVVAVEGLRVGASTCLDEKPRYHITWDVDRYDVDGSHLGTSRVEGNLLTTAGLTRLTSLLNGAGGNALTTTTARIGVGDGAGTAAVGDTDLSAASGSTHRWFQTCTVSTSAAVVTLVGTFGTADGNFAWNEFGIDIGTATVSSGNTVAATLFNHKTSIAQGTKASGQSWAVTVTITFS